MPAVRAYKQLEKGLNERQMLDILHERVMRVSTVAACFYCLFFSLFSSNINFHAFFFFLVYGVRVLSKNQMVLRLSFSRVYLVNSFLKDE